MKKTVFRQIVAIFALSFILSLSADAFTNPLLGSRSSVKNPSHFTVGETHSNELVPNENAVSLKTQLLEKVKTFREIQLRDGDVAIDFGVKGGELNETSRAPQKVDYYSISRDLGEAADGIIKICDELSAESPTDVPTKYLGDKENGSRAPLNGTWRLLFTTAADASFSSKNSTRGTAVVSNDVDAARGRLTNIIQFNPQPDGSKPVVDSLNVVLEGKATSDKRVSLRFRYVKVLLNKFFFFPLFGKRLRLYIPVPGPFITRLIVFFSRILKFGRKKGIKKPPQAYFDLLYLDKDLRVQRTGEDNTFVQVKETWDAARPFLS